jgi:N6-L-threonylcarbamoyladenine synthase
MNDNNKTKYILGVETTCDETGLAIVEKELNGKPKIIHNLIYSQEKTHQKTKGVVPEIAAREQINKIFPLLNKLDNKFAIKDIDAIGLAYGPGLVGSLLVGINFAKSLSYAFKKPLIPVNHIVAHLYGSLIETKKELKFPALGLIVSGGHTSMVKLKNHRDIKLLGQTRDDAAGESFDKAAILLGLNYPGGPEIERVAKKPPKDKRYNLPRPLLNNNSYDFSFSGLKTALWQIVKNNQLSSKQKSYLAYEFQEAVVEVLTKKLEKTALEENIRSVILGGGVISNSRLREELKKKALPNLIIPKKTYCTDNGAIIATRASYLDKESDQIDWRELEVSPNLGI